VIRRARHRIDPLTCRIGPLEVRSHEILPASCAAAIPVGSSPATKPRVPPLDRANRASSASITLSRSHSTLNADRPAFAVSDRSGAGPHLLSLPPATCRRTPQPAGAGIDHETRTAISACLLVPGNARGPANSLAESGQIEMPGLELLEVRRPPPELNGQRDQPIRLMPTHPRVRKHGRS
jgi:hypothetical protein